MFFHELHLLISQIKIILKVYAINCVCPDFYTAWEVVAKDLLDYSTDPVLAHR